MFVEKNLKKVLQNTIWIVGSVRTGTSILGKILSTLKTVEYAFEPEFLFKLLPKINTINKNTWLNLYNSYIIEELFFNLCVGRRINFKKNDDSFIGNSLSARSIRSKLKIKLSRLDFENYLKKFDKNLIIKIHSVTRSLSALEKYYPKNKFIVTQRDERKISASIIKKKWFKNNQNLPISVQNPDLFGKKKYKRWLKLNEKEKIKHYLKQVNLGSKKIKNKYIFVYENFINNPNKEINKLCNFLNLKKTSKTKELINTIKKPL